MLKLDGVSAGYDGRAVIHDISLEVGAGEIVALLGANGAGKSTLARCLSGLLPALGGRVWFDGREITGAAPAERVRAGLIHVPEGRQVFAGLTVAQNLELGSYLVRDAGGDGGYAQRCREVYAQFPVLRERATSFAGNLSGGQQQMMAIARALMARPRLLILDEPSLGLSPLLVQEVFQLVARLRDRGIAILLSEQNARASLAIADRGVVIENGRVAATGLARDLLASGDIAARYLGLGAGGGAVGLDDKVTTRLTAVIRDRL